MVSYALPLVTSPPSYTTVHVRARQIMGDTCVRCGNADQLHAALKLDTPETRLLAEARSGCKYSVSHFDYEALCPRCHFRQDFGSKTHCRNGHEYTPENTGVGKGESRRCKTCERKGRPPRPRRSAEEVQAAAQERQRVRDQKLAEREASAQNRETWRERYARDPVFRESEKAKSRRRYRAKHSVYVPLTAEQKAERKRTYERERYANDADHRERRKQAASRGFKKAQARARGEQS